MKLKNKNILIIALVFLLIDVSYTTNAGQKIKTGNGKIIPFSSLSFLDIGSATKTGSTTIKEDELTIVAGGADIWGTHDEFRFAYKMVKGDFDISLQILSLSATNLYTKAGIMARTDLSDNCQHVYFQVFPDNSPRNHNNGGCELQYRLVKGGEMKAIYPDVATAGHKFEVAFPKIWIRLKRTGNVFESYFSSDNINWILYSTFTTELPEKLFLGIAVTAHDGNKQTTAGFGTLRLKN